MSTFGLTDDGLVIKTLSDIDSEIDQALRAAFGEHINTLPESVFGQIKAVFADREASVWELIEDVYNSQYPDTATGTSLDNVTAITGTERDEAQFSEITGQALFGTPTTPIPIDTVFSVLGNTSVKFKTKTAVVIGTGTDEIQRLAFSGVPTSGNFKLNYVNVFGQTETTSLIPFGATAADVATALNALTSLSGGSGSGGPVGSNIDLTFATADGKQPQPLLTVTDNTLQNGGAITITVTEQTAGVFQVIVDMIATATGAKVANAGTLTVIDNPVTGLASTFNPSDADVGSAIESDSELRIKRNQQIQKPGGGTVEAIRAAILDITVANGFQDDVESAIVLENDTDAVDGNGLPAHSVAAYVDGGDEDDIAGVIWLRKGGGITTHGNISKIVVDSQGVNRTVKLSRPIDENIWVIVDVTSKTAEYGGDTAVENAVLAYGLALQQGDDVIVHGSDSLECAISAAVAGITEMDIKVGTAPAPTLDDPIPIDITERARFDSGRITVNS